MFQGWNSNFGRGTPWGQRPSAPPPDEICHFPDSESVSQSDSLQNSPSADSAANDLTLSDDDYDNRVDADFGNETAIKCATVHTTVPVGGCR